MSSVRRYTKEYKLEALKLVNEIGAKRASEKLKIPYGTLYDWVKAERKGMIETGEAKTPGSALSLAEENEKLRKQLKEQTKENKRLTELNEFLEEASAFFRSEPSEVSKNERMKFIALMTEDGRKTGKISFYSKALKVSRQGFYEYLKNNDKPWKYEDLADVMKEIVKEDECNDTYGRIRMHQALTLKHGDSMDIPSERTIYRVMEQAGLSHSKKRKPNGITKADHEARKSEDKLQRDFSADAPDIKSVTDITEVKASDGKLYTSVIFDCFDLTALGISIGDNMKSELCVNTIENAMMLHPKLRGMILHSDRGSQYTSDVYREAIEKNNLIQSMNSDGGRCHDNARCESMWARMKEELFYSRNRKTEDYTREELRTMIWRYFMSYWNNRRICSANDGLPPAIKRERYYESLRVSA